MPTIQPGDTVYVFDRYRQMYAKATVIRDTPKFHEVQGVMFNKETLLCGYKNTNSIQGKLCRSIALVSPALDAEWDRLVDRKRLASVERENKSALAGYVDFIQSRYAHKLSPEQVAECVQALQGILGPVGDLGGRVAL